MTYYVYILYSESADKYYVGQTNDINLRLEFHNSISNTSFTSKHRPWLLKTSIPVYSRYTAIRVEQYIKKRKSRKYIEAIIANDNAVKLLLEKFESI